MNVAELKGMQKDELEAKVTTLREGLFKLRFKATTDPVTDAAGLRRKRKEIAMIRTALRQQEIEAGATPENTRTTRAFRKSKRESVANAAERKAQHARRGRGTKG